MADLDTDEFATALYELESALQNGELARAHTLAAELRERFAVLQGAMDALAVRLKKLVAKLAALEAKERTTELVPSATPLDLQQVTVDLERLDLQTDKGLEDVTVVGPSPGLRQTPSPTAKGLPAAKPIRIKISANDSGLDLSASEVGTQAAAPASPPPKSDDEADKGHLYRVWFGTNRRPLEPQNPASGFGTERNAETTFGHVDVWVPKAHRFGETGNSFFTRLKRLDLRDDRLRVRNVVRQDAETVWSALQAEMRAATARGDAADALVFLHGYKTTFEEAAIRAAQLGVDLHVPGATAFYSWPSRGKLEAYTADEASVEASEAAITAFLCEFTARCGAQRVHLIAHSMGNRALLRALQRIAANAETRGRVRFGQIFLAAPDLDRDLFLDLARLYAEHSERTTLYASDSDLPVHVSGRLHGAPRAGYFLPYTVAPNIDTIAVPNFDIDLLGHSYFAQAAALLHDMHDLMRHYEPPQKRQRLNAVVNAGLALWEFVR